MHIDYLKMLGAGNRILIADRRNRDVTPPSAAQLRQLGDESTGPGFDQLMWVMAPSDPAMDASYRVFNADGSEVEQCGNGVRCVAWMLAKDEATQTDFRLESPAGIIEASVHSDDRVTVSMGPPEFEPGKIPFVADSKSDGYFLTVGDDEYDVSVLSMGNPHCILQVADVSTADVARLGAIIEHHERFPARTNVGFMAIRGRRQIDLRVHERGVGETQACGTGACAAVVAGQRLGYLDDEVTVSLPGGQLVVSWRGGVEAVWLSGNTDLTSKGTIEL